MAAPDVNTTGFSMCRESAPSGGLAVLPGSPLWRLLEVNSVSKWGASLKDVRRQPISKTRLPRSSTVVDLDSAVGMTLDMTRENLRAHMAAMMFCVDGLGVERDTMIATAVTATGVTVPTGAVLPNGRLAWTSGFAQSANNGLKLLAGTSTATEIKFTGTVIEASAPSNATVEICGVQGASADLVVDEAGNLTSTILDFTTLGWLVGQWLHLGDPASGAAFRFAEITDAMYANGEGFVRIRAIAAHVVTVDKNETLVALAGGAPGTGKTVRVLYGPFYREWAADHGNFSAIYHRFEAAFLGLSGGSDAYSYPNGNLLNTFKLDCPLDDLMRIETEWVGLDTPIPTTARATNASTALQPRLIQPFNTTSSWRRKRLATKTGTAVCTALKNLTVTIANGISPEKVQAQLGAFKMNIGDRTADAESTWLFDDPAIWSNMRNHTSLTMDMAFGGSDGGFAFDFPTVVISGGEPGLERNTTVTTTVKVMPERDVELDYMLGVTIFPYLP